MLERGGLALILAFIWGVVYAIWLQKTKRGKVLAARLTWLSVILGCSVNLTIALLIIEPKVWMTLVGIFAVSGLPIVIRSVNNEIDLIIRLVQDGTRNTSGE